MSPSIQLRMTINRLDVRMPNPSTYRFVKISQIILAQRLDQIVVVGHRVLVQPLDVKSNWRP